MSPLLGLADQVVELWLALYYLWRKLAGIGQHVFNLIQSFHPELKAPSVHVVVGWEGLEVVEALLLY